MSSFELPPICPDDEHDWASFSVHGCGALPDDHAIDETVVLAIPTNEPGPGATCQKCFQLWGEKENKRHRDLEDIYRALSVW